MANAPGTLLDTMSTQVQTCASLIEQTKQQEQQLFTLRSRLLKMDHWSTRTASARAAGVAGTQGVPQDGGRAAVGGFRPQPSGADQQGALDGVYNGQPVINDQGWSVRCSTWAPPPVGSCSSPTPATASRCGCCNDLRAIASGSGELDKLSCATCPATPDVQVGDLLVTRGPGGRFPEGYPVATVTRLTTWRASPSAQIEAKPWWRWTVCATCCCCGTDKKPEVHDRCP